MNDIICIDCLEGLKNLPDNSVDIVFADPPFNLKKIYKANKDNLNDKDYLDWCYSWLEEIVRVVKGSVFIHNIPKWLPYFSVYLNNKMTFKHWISWEARSGPMGKSLQPCHYGILYYSKVCKFYELRSPHKRCRKCDYLLKDYGGKKAGLHPYGPLVSDVWTDIHRVFNRKDNHPCQLPIRLLERIILMSTDEGDTVLDPFIGTGTTAVAAKKLGRNFIGFDCCQEYVNKTKERLKEIKPTKIGNIYASVFREEIVTIRDIDSQELLGRCQLPSNPRDIDFTKVKIIP